MFGYYDRNIFRFSSHDPFRFKMNSETMLPIDTVSYLGLEIGPLQTLHLHKIRRDNTGSRESDSNMQRITL
jgi:hypothetical protein